jgi:hypothetical protein
MEESLEVLRGVLRLYPDSGIVRKLIADVSSRSSRPKPEAVAEAAGSAGAVVVVSPAARVPDVAQPPVVAPAPLEAAPPVLEQPEVRPPAVTPGPPAPARLTPRRIEQPVEPVTVQPPTATVQPDAVAAEPAQTALTEVVDDGRIVSRTLAEIYAGQGAFEEAIHTYKLLRKKRPADAAQIDERIAELEAQTLSSKP